MRFNMETETSPSDCNSRRNDKNPREMEGENYAEGQNYHYGYDQAYYVNPNNISQADYYNEQHYGGWGWQPPEYGPVHAPAHGGYVNPYVSYDGYVQYPENGSYGPQGYMNSMQSRPNSRSKYSYSQNRNRNRQRPDLRQSAAVNSFNPQTENNFNNNNSADDNITTGGTERLEVDNMKTGNNGGLDCSSHLSEMSAANSKSNERNKSHGGRFMGTDSRSKQFDAKKQAIDRQKSYDKRFQSDRSRTVANKVDKQDIKNDNIADSGANSTDSVMDMGNTGVKQKFFRDGRSNTGYHKDRGGKSSQDSSRFGRKGQRQYYDKGKGAESEAPGSALVNDRPKADSPSGSSIERNEGLMEGKETSGSSRRKKKEYQVYSSNSPRETQGKVQYSQRDAFDRYNFRGQDYNKRHKEISSQSLEKGGDRTKISIDMDGEKDTESKTEYAGPDNGDFENRGMKDYKKKVQGPQRGNRSKNKAKVDESQRGVLIEQLGKGSYECMVCCDSVRSTNAVWSCSGCYHIFHLRCIKKWAKTPNAVVSGTERDGWRCPACQSVSFKFPNQYRCFCGKVRDPEVSRMDTPHSCGDVCQRDRGEGCKHPCNILCHPGPCPECVATVTKACDCGKTKQSAKCSQSTVIKCELVCERMLNCGRHFCKAKCHSGSCEKCDIMITQECYGEHEKREVVCGSEQSFTESYNCTAICVKMLDCGNHTCEQLCHRGNCDTCPLLPSNLTHCPCGAKQLSELSDTKRTSCLDPIPTCGAVCNKVLDCGPEGSHHRCDRPCHEGPCGPCNGMTVLPCRCLFMDKEYKCSEITDLQDGDPKFLCDKRCNRKKSCGRHKCGQPCCVREEHPCELICGRKLSCGLHKCMELCHKNNCPPCLMAGFEELTCHCGTEVLYPPIPCGTLPPECHRPCTREHGCDHTVRHNCHSDEKCPPCTELTQKMCMGNHVRRANIPCHLTEISCGMKCSKPLPCGQHRCIRTCHKGACLEEGQICQQLCQQRREYCEHICGAVCHGEEPCPKTVCKAKVQVKCPCGNREVESTCSNGDVSSDYQRSAINIVFSSTPVNISKLNQGKLGQGRVLECNEECALLERNKRMAAALDIQNPNLTSKLGAPVYSDFLKEFAKKEPSFVAGIEKVLSELVQSAKQSKQAQRSHAFPCMKLNHRRLVHELAEVYNCQTQSYDNEPNKNVVATASRDKCVLPSVTLTAMVQRGLHPGAPPPIPHVHKEDVLRQANIASKQSTSLLGDRDSSSPEGWQVMGKKTKKAVGTTPKSAIATIDKFEKNLTDICSTGTINYNTLSKASKDALKSEPVVDYFDFTVN